jgi:hypothetical protein
MSLSSVEHKIVNALEIVGKDFAKGLAITKQYLPAAVTLASLIFPAQSAAISGVVNAVDLIQTAVVEVEQKYTASNVGKSNESNAQKLADVISLVSPTVTSLLSAEGVKVDNAAISNIVNAVVAILKVQVVPVAA